MKLTFLGRGSAFHPSLGNTAAYYMEGTRLLLLDCGETVFQQLMGRGLLAGVTEVDLLLSHTHSDHCGSLGTLGQYCRYALQIPLRIIVPEDEAYVRKLRQLAALFGLDEQTCLWLPDSTDPGFTAFSRVRYVPTVHAPGMQSFSFVFETPGGGVFYSGDTSDTGPLLRFMAEHPDFEAAYMDAADADFPGCVHLSVGQLAACVPAHLRSRVRLMHFNSDRCAALGSEMGFDTEP